MSEIFDRRQFTLSTAAGLGGLFLPGWGPSTAVHAEVPAISQHRLIELGANALARSAEMNYFADGHRGASMISAHLMCVDNNFDDAASSRIVELFDKNWANAKLCADFPEQDPLPVEEATRQIGLAFADGSGVLRQVGHDAIFAMHAIKAFRMDPELATPDRVAGTCRLIRAFKPWRDVAPAEDVQPPPFDQTEAASRYVLKEASAAIDRFSGFGQGFAGHMLTFGQSLIEMAAMGDVEWAESGRVAFRKYVTVTRMGPQADDRKIKDHAQSPLRPNSAEYWQQRGDKSLGLGHVFKYPYAYYDLLTRANDPQLKQELDAKAWQIF